MGVLHFKFNLVLIHSTKWPFTIQWTRHYFYIFVFFQCVCMIDISLIVGYVFVHWKWNGNIIFVILKILHWCLKEWLKFNVQLRWWAIVNEYWDLSQIFECLEGATPWIFSKHIVEVIKSNSYYYIKNSSILLQIEVFIYSFVNSSLGLLVFIPHWKQHNLTWDCYLLL